MLIAVLRRTKEPGGSRIVTERISTGCTMEDHMLPTVMEFAGRTSKGFDTH